MEVFDFVKLALFVLVFSLVVFGWISSRTSGKGHNSSRDGISEGKDPQQPVPNQSKVIKPSIDDLTFDSTGFEQGDQKPTSRAWAKSDGDESEAWRNSEGDVILLFFRGCPPDYPTGVKDLKEFYASIVGAWNNNGFPVVDLNEFRLDVTREFACIIRCIKDGRAVLYESHISIPFKSHYYEIQIGCKEWAETGVRESMAFQLWA